MTAELGRQPWLVYGLMRTADGTSHRVSAGSVAFSTLGFTGLYFVVGLLFVFLVLRAIARGPVASGQAHAVDEGEGEDDDDEHSAAHEEPEAH
jgi:cytochrome d ubiquinol oxidase subunit I